MDVQKVSAIEPEVAESATSLIFGRDAENPAVCVVDGYGVEITTRSGRLMVHDGIGTHRRKRVYARASHGLARLVVMGTTGHVTIEALRRLEGAGVGLVVMDPSSGDVISASTRVANDDARVRRAQALAPGTETGLAVAKYLTRVKLCGQAAIAGHELSVQGVADTITTWRNGRTNRPPSKRSGSSKPRPPTCTGPPWGSLEVDFVKKDTPRVPSNWLCFEGRRSAINPGSPRNASDPVNALLNYNYRLLEVEGHLATLAVGLDPGLGVLHADTKGRASFVLDLIEAARPVAERHVVRLIRSQPLRWRDFNEDSRGVVRVLPPLTHRLAEAMPGFATTLAPIVEHVAQMIASASPYDVSNPSILTKEKHKAAARRRVATAATVAAIASPVGPGSVGLSPRKKARQRPPADSEPSLPLPVCRGCGALLEPESDRKRRRGAYCPGCLARRRAEIGSVLPAASANHRSEFQKVSGVRPTHTPEASGRRKQALIAQRSQQALWEAEHSDEDHDPEWFRSEILPGLSTLTLPQIAKATGMSTSAASKIRAGRAIPHPRHWEALARFRTAE